MITQIDAVGKSDMRLIVQKQVDECSVPFGGTNRFTDESCPVIGRIPQVPSKFVGVVALNTSVTVRPESISAACRANE